MPFNGCLRHALGGIGFLAAFADAEPLAPAAAGVLAFGAFFRQCGLRRGARGVGGSEAGDEGETYLVGLRASF